jgi:hypothetical protein
VTGPVQFARYSAAERSAAIAIVKRAVALFGGTEIDWHMDLAAVHYTCPLRLTDLAVADVASFGHDLGGIRRFLDRTTGELRNCFVPRLAVPEAPPDS